MTTTPQAEGLRTLCDVFSATVRRFADEQALRNEDGTTVLTWADYQLQVLRAAAAFDGIGVEHSDTVALWLNNRPEFHCADTAAVHLGAAPFSIYSTFTVEQAAHVIADAGSRVLVTERAYLDRALAVRAICRTPLDWIIVVDAPGDAPGVLAWNDFVTGDTTGFDLEAIAAAVRPNDLATLIYTSGTTGVPKGVELTHANIIAQTAALQKALNLPSQLRTLSWLPMAHIAERICSHYLPMTLGWSVVCNSDPRQVASTVASTRPELFFSPPRLWTKLRAAVRIGHGDSPDPAAAREAVGLDRAKFALVGAAPSPAGLIASWHELGVPLCEVYGLSETTGVATITPPLDAAAGVGGTTVPSAEVRIAPDGEVLVRGPIIMRGYRNRPDQTAEALDVDGWLHTGDIGTSDDEGRLKIVDRRKEIIINSAGKNMSPATIESELKSANDIIGNVCCIGDAKPYNVALITLDTDAVGRFSRDHGLVGTPGVRLSEAAEVQQAIASSIEKANQRLSRVERIKRFKILAEDWVPGGPELTPTMKLKRKEIEMKYAADIDELYADAEI